MKKRLAIVTAGAMVFAVALGPVTRAASNTFHGPLTAISGSGSGHVAGAATGAGQGTSDVQGEVNVNGTTPNTTFTIQRSADAVPDGNCDTSGGFAVLGTFTTSPGGAGAEHFHRTAPIPSGAIFDILFQVVGADGTLFQSPCFTVTIK